MPGQGISISLPRGMLARSVAVSHGWEMVLLHKKSEWRIRELCPLVQSQRVMGLMFTFSRADLPNLRSLQSCFFTLLAQLGEGRTETRAKSSLGKQAGSCVAPLLKVDSWPPQGHGSCKLWKEWRWSCLGGAQKTHPGFGSTWEDSRNFVPEFLFCFVHRPLKETAVTTSKGSLSHHSPPMSCQESVMAQVHP